MRCAVACLTVSLSLAAGAAVAATATLESVDPLSRPAPEGADQLLLPKDVQAPAAKVVPQLWSRLATLGPDDELRVIIELQQPLLRTKAALYSPAWDEAQTEASAAMAHRFAAAATGRVRELRGLSHFPIVFGTTTRRELDELARLPEVYRVYEDEEMRVHRAQGGPLINANVLRTTHGGSGNGVGVAVLDTGVATHSEFGNRIKAQFDATGTTGDGRIDDNGHGTNAAGIIAGNNGMAPLAHLWAVKVLKANGSGSAADTLSGLNAVFASRNQFGGVHVVNMSLGGSGPFNSACDGASPYNSVFNSLVNAGIAIFVSSGNEAFKNGVAHPACHSKAIAVGAVYDANLGKAQFDNCTDNGTAADKITCYSNSGNLLAILAPSHCANTPKPGGGFDTCFGGTSAAAPYAAGVAAQLLSLKPTTTPAALRTALSTTGKNLTDTNGITRRRIDAVAAFQALGGGGHTGPCVRDADTACLLDNRFEVEVDWHNAQGSGKAQVMSFGGQRAENSESVFFWFFGPTNFEMGLKMLNGCGLNNRFWVFISGLTNQGWTVRIRDIKTGATQTYGNQLNKLTATTADTGALPCP
jgi:subtilisin family serine protease